MKIIWEQNNALYCIHYEAVWYPLKFPTNISVHAKLMKYDLVHPINFLPLSSLYGLNITVDDRPHDGYVVALMGRIWFYEYGNCTT